MELPRGMKDFESSENANIEHIRYHFKQLSNLYGFSFMDTSLIAGPDFVSSVDNNSIGDVSINENPYRFDNCLKWYLMCSMFVFSEDSKSFIPRGSSIII